MFDSCNSTWSEADYFWILFLCLTLIEILQQKILEEENKELNFILVIFSSLTHHWLLEQNGTCICAHISLILSVYLLNAVEKGCLRLFDNHSY